MPSILSWFHVFIIVTSCVFFFSPCTYAENHPAEPAESVTIFPDTFADKVKAICIYEVRNGRVQPKIFSGNDLKTRKAIQVNGYTSGIVLFTTECMNISVDDRQMETFPINRDGTYKLKESGDFDHLKLLTTLNHSDPQGHTLPNLDQMKGRYCYFPKIRGDAVCKQSIFNIELSIDNMTLTLPVNQTGSLKFYNTGSVHAASQDTLSFLDVGNNLSRLDKASPDFTKRIAALSKGIQTAESRFQTKLVDTINILNYNDADNAFTYKGEKQIWIYNQTFKKVSPRELHSLAEHEACHILIDSMDLTLNDALRKHFADLKGFGAFSLERFMLVTLGSIPGAGLNDTSSNSHFFAFINEKNFIKGMTGGHSQDNLEEFCASFLHSTLYIDRLYSNLQRPITLRGGKKHHLTKDEKSKLFEIYKKTITLFHAAAQKESGPTYLSRYLQATTQMMENEAVPGETARVACGRNVQLHAPAIE